MRHFVFVLAWLIGAAVLAQGADPAPAKPAPSSWEITNIGVTRRAESENAKPEDLQSHVHTFIGQSLRLPGKHIQGLDLSRCVINSFVDDLGTDLTVSGDRRQMLFERLEADEPQQVAVLVASDKLPARRASLLRLKGAAAVRLAGKETVVEMKGVMLKDKPVKVGIFQIYKSTDWTDDKKITSTRIGVNSPGRSLKRIEFLDARGRILTAKTDGEIQTFYRHPFSKNDPFVPAGSVKPDDLLTELSQDFTVQGNVAGMTVRITYFEKGPTILVPFDVTATVGMGAESTRKPEPASDKQAAEKAALVEAESIQVDKSTTSTDVVLKIEQPGKAILSVDRAACELIRFTDNCRTNLKDAAPKSGAMRVDPFTYPLGDRTAIQVAADRLPDSHATRLRIQGIAALQIATGEKTAEDKQVTLPLANDLAVGPFTVSSRVDFEILDVAKNGPALQITVGAKTRCLKSIEFVDSQGKAIAHNLTNMSVRYRGENSSGFFMFDPVAGSTHVPLDYDSVQYNYTVKCKPGVISVRIVYYDQSETVKVPFDLDFGVGL